MPQNLNAYAQATTLEGAKQVIAQGPVASQEVIKMMGTNGGGFFNANSAHPFENPNAVHQFRPDGADLLDRRGADQCVRPHGRQSAPGLGDLRRHGHSVLSPGSPPFIAAEAAGNPAFAALHVDQAPSALQAGGNMEGKEVRFGIANSALFTTVTTDASCGAVNTMHDSLMPLGGMVPMVNIMLGEIIFGGVGSGLYGMLLFAILAVFIAGLMVGRTPEYLGKKIEAQGGQNGDACHPHPAAVDPWASRRSPRSLPAGLAGPANAGPHGFSEILYAFVSATGNNGSAFAGISANTPFYNTTLGLAMCIGRFLMIVPMLAIAGSLAGKKIVPPRPALSRPMAAFSSVC